eukprot:SAG11_NODE_3315_length_2528_cov_1.375463_2_plen_28_part_01
MYLSYTGKYDFSRVPALRIYRILNTIGL